jgi:hypothetical protein
MRLRLWAVILGLSLCLLMPALARADAVYTYSLSVPASCAPEYPTICPSTVDWSFEVPSILPSDTTIPASSLLSESVGGEFGSQGCMITSVEIIPTAPVDINTFFTGADCANPEFSSPAFPAGTEFNSYTTYTAVESTLEITNTPEPSSLTLYGLGLVALFVGVKLRRFHDNALR